MALKIYGNLDRLSLTSGLVQSATNLIARPAPALVAGDSVTVDVFLTGQNGLLNIQDYPTRRLGVGNLNARPTGGTWDLGAQTGLAYDISAASLQSAITSETAANTTTQLTAFVFKVVFTANGAQTIPTVDATALTPSSTVNIARLVTGDASTQEEWLIRIFQNPIALIDASWTNISGSGIRGSLNLGTEGVYDLLNGSTSASTYIELELTDASGDISTIFQVPVTINGEVIGEGVTGVATFDSYVTSSSLKGLPGLTPSDEAVIRGNGTDWVIATNFRVDAGTNNSGTEMGTGVANGNYAVAEGFGTTASDTASHAEGESSTASGSASHAEGFTTTASGSRSHAEGDSTTASGAASHAEGNATTASGNRSHAEGSSTIASAAASHAEGDSTTASGIASHAEGFSSTASGDYSSATGRRAKAIHNGARVEADSQDADVSSTTTDQYTARFQNGYEFKDGDANFEGGVITPSVTATFVYANSIQVNGGGTVNMFQKYATSQNFGSIAGHSTATATFSATGVDTTAFTFSDKPDAIADPFIVSAKPTAADVIELQVHNTSNNSQSAPTATYNVLAIKFS